MMKTQQEAGFSLMLIRAGKPANFYALDAISSEASKNSLRPNPPVTTEASAEYSPTSSTSSTAMCFSSAGSSAGIVL